MAWGGGKPKDKTTEICLNSWRRCLPDYEIIKWNEKNLEIDKICSDQRFLRTCMNLGLWAFASDYLRLYVLYHYGGIYLDTDVEVLRSFTPLLSNQMFLGFEENDYIGTAVIASEPGNKIIRRILDFYEQEIWNVDFINNPIIFRYLMDREPELFQSCIVYPQSYFSPYVPEKKYENTVEDEETYSIHWYTQNWNMSRKGYVFIHTKHIRNPIKKGITSIRKNLGYMIRKR